MGTAKKSLTWLVVALLGLCCLAAPSQAQQQTDAAVAGVLFVGAPETTGDGDPGFGS